MAISARQIYHDDSGARLPAQQPVDLVSMGVPAAQHDELGAHGPGQPDGMRKVPGRPGRGDDDGVESTR